jgi:hypothetical protein
MFVPNSSPAKSVMEFIAHAKAQPGTRGARCNSSGPSGHEWPKGSTVRSRPPRDKKGFASLSGYSI